MKSPKIFIVQLKIKETDSQSELIRDEPRAMALDSWARTHSNYAPYLIPPCF